jgi:hypothetical protein
MSIFSLSSTLLDTLNTWVIQLRDLSFRDNFRGYEWAGSIEPGAEQAIPHRLKVTPTKFIVLSAKGTQAIIEGDTRHTLDFFYVKNVATTSRFSGRILVLP